MLLETPVRREFREKVGAYNPNRTPPDKCRDDKRSDTQKDRDASQDCVVPWQRLRRRSQNNPYVQVHRHEQKRSVAGLSSLGHPSGRITERLAQSFRFTLTGVPKCLVASGGESPLVQRVTRMASRGLRAKGRGVA